MHSVEEEMLIDFTLEQRRGGRHERRRGVEIQALRDRRHQRYDMFPVARRSHPLRHLRRKIRKKGGQDEEEIDEHGNIRRGKMRGKNRDHGG